MKAVRFREFGGPEVLNYEEVPEPQLRKDQVLVRVRACAMNHLDLWVRKGLPGVKLPHINGSDIAGEIAEVGEYVQRWSKGKRVIVAPMHYCGRCASCLSGVQNLCREFTVLGNGVDGGNCELIAVRPDQLVAIPDDLSFDQAAAVPLVFLTAYHMMVTRAHIRPGQTVVVLGANSGVGIAAIQLGKLLNAHVIATAGNEEKIRRARELGADDVIDHYKQKISDEVRRITAKAMADVVIEHVGEATWGESMKSLKPGGVIVTCGATTGPQAEFDLRFLFARQLSFLGSYMGTMGELHEVLAHVFAGRLKGIVDSTYSLAEARAAHERMEKSEMFGKIVFSV